MRIFSRSSSRRSAISLAFAAALGAAGCSAASSGGSEPQVDAASSSAGKAGTVVAGKGGTAGQTGLSGAAGMTAGSVAGKGGGDTLVDAAAPADTGPQTTADAALAKDTGTASADATPMRVPWTPPEGSLNVAAVSNAKVENYVDLDRPAEGPSYVDGNVFACGSQVIKVDANKKRVRYSEINCAGSFAMADGSLLVAAEGMGVVQILPDDKWVTIAKPKDILLNDLTVDANGVIYTTMLPDPKAVWRVTPEGAADKIAEGLGGPNGIEVDPESKYLYVAMAEASQIVRYPLPAPGKMLGGGEVVISGIGTPDGLAFDGWGNLWVAQYGGGSVVVVDVKGKKRLTQLNSGLGSTTNVTFGGPNRDQVFMTGDMKIMRATIPGLRGFPGHPGAASYKALAAPKAATLKPF